MTKVLHIVGTLNHGGVESWLKQVVECIDRSSFQLDFLSFTQKECSYDADVRALGAKVIACPPPSHPLAFARGFARVLNEHGPYDVVHSHIHFCSGFVLWLAHRAGVPMRIVHSHSDTRSEDSELGMPRRAYTAVSKWLIGRYATKHLAASKLAARALFGEDWEQRSGARLLYCGIDLSQFRQAVDRTQVRKGLGLPDGAVVLGHVGRLVKVKNHSLVLEVAQRLVSRRSDVFILLVGEGPMRPEIEAGLRSRGLESNVLLLGSRRDVPRLMLAAMDVFVFPSHCEGLGLAVVEAQAAGLPCVISSAIPQEVEVVPQMIKRLSVSDPVDAWADAIEESALRGRRLSQSEALAIVECSHFNITASVRELERVYAREV